MTVRTPSKRGAATPSQPRGTRAESANPVRRVRGAAWLLTFLAVLGSVHALVMVGAELVRYQQVTRSVRQLVVDVAELEAEVAGLADVIDHGDDPVYREQLARKQGYVYPDEILMIPKQP